MSVIATAYTYTLYIGQTFLFGEECIGSTYVMILHMHAHEYDELRKKPEET
jgi:hypothetical protein